MNAPEIALRHQQLAARAAQLQHGQERARTELASHAEVEGLRGQRAAAETRLAAIDSSLRGWAREVEAHRARVQTRQRDLMSGRLKNSSELMRLDHEVQALKAKLREEEDRELELMEKQEEAQKELERLGAELGAAEQRAEVARPVLEERLRGADVELAEVEAELGSVWSALPSDWQAAYHRVQSRLADPVAQVDHAQCQRCRVGVTSNGMQVLRKGSVVLCDNCGRLLVMV